jgi:prophage regulatory protein
MTTAQTLALLLERLARVEALLESIARSDVHRENKRAERVDPSEASSSTILRLTDVKKKTGLGRATIYAQQTEGVFPPSVNVGVRAVGWIESEVDAVLAARASGADESTLKKLVEVLVASRRPLGR